MLCLSKVTPFFFIMAAFFSQVARCRLPPCDRHRRWQPLSRTLPLFLVEATNIDQGEEPKKKEGCEELRKMGI